jgi:hypothetical protein
MRPIKTIGMADTTGVPSKETPAFQVFHFHLSPRAT